MSLLEEEFRSYDLGHLAILAQDFFKQIPYFAEAEPSPVYKYGWLTFRDVEYLLQIIQGCGQRIDLGNVRQTVQGILQEKLRITIQPADRPLPAGQPDDPSWKDLQIELVLEFVSALDVSPALLVAHRPFTYGYFFCGYTLGQLEALCNLLVRAGGGEVNVIREIVSCSKWLKLERRDKI